MFGTITFFMIPLLWALTAAKLHNTQISFSSFTPSSYLNSTGLTEDVQWDGYSFFVKGQRLFIYSGSVHPFRNPSTELYLDVFQRIKALGFNAISFYAYWGMYNPSPDVLDFDGWKNVEPFLQAANTVGLWVLARPGPWVNGELAAGGIPPWVTTLNCSLRTADPIWTAAYTPYWTKMAKVLADLQISNGGPVIAVQIENEYTINNAGDYDRAYVAHLESLMRESNVTVPLFVNDNGQHYNLLDGFGSPNIYGSDSYPQSKTCSDPQVWDPVLLYRPFFQNASGRYGEPFFIPEMQAGWIPSPFGSQNCLPLYDSTFEKVFYLNNIAQGIKAQNIYMTYGGTNWGHISYPQASTSYDYWAPISEDRSLKDKYYALKLLSHWIRSSSALPKTRITQSSNSTLTSAAPGDIQVDVLTNPDNDAGFWVIRHANSSSLDDSNFELNLTDWYGQVTVPVTLCGRDSKVLTTNHCWGASCILHSSASIFTSASIDDCDYLILYGSPGQTYQIAFEFNYTVKPIEGDSSFNITRCDERTVAVFDISTSERSVLRVSGGRRDILVHILDEGVVNFAWEAVVPAQTNFGAHYAIGSNETVLVFGPYFFRWVSSNCSQLDLQGDLNETTTVLFAAHSKYNTFSWNGQVVHPSKTASGLWNVTLDGPATAPISPSIMDWKYRDSLPEIQPTFDDSGWVAANHTTTNNPNKPYPNYVGEYILYGQDYGFGLGCLLLRGTFNGSSSIVSLNVSASMGPGGAAAFWLNERYLGNVEVPGVDPAIQDTNTTIIFPPDLLLAENNVLTIVMSSNGLESGTALPWQPFYYYATDTPRGLRGYSLINSDGSPNDTEISWRIQGTLGGFSDFPDKTRTLYNVGGLYGERQGWYLPGYKDSDWSPGGPWGSGSLQTPGVRFYRATVQVEYPDGIDVHYSFLFPNATGLFHAQLFVNGWQFGRRLGNPNYIGSQLRYPIPPGILTAGDNEIALSLFGFNDSNDALSIGGPLQLVVDPSVTTTRSNLSCLSVDSPGYLNVFGNLTNSIGCD